MLKHSTDLLVHHSSIGTVPTVLLIAISITHLIVRTNTRVPRLYIVPRDRNLFVVFIICLRIFREVLLHQFWLLHYLYFHCVLSGFPGAQLGMHAGEECGWLRASRWGAVDSFTTADGDVKVESTKSEEDAVACDGGDGWGDAMVELD